MRTKKRFYKLMACLLAFVMFVSLAEGISLTAYAATIADSYNYKIKVKNSSVKKAGTDADVFCIVKTHDGARIQTKIDSGANDFEKNDCREYTVNLELQPWEIKEVGLRCGGKDAMHIAWFEWKLPNGTVVKREPNAWFENQKGGVAERTYSVWTSVDRQIKTTGNFDSQFSGEKYIAPGTTTGQSDIVMTWNGKVSDQYFSEYNFFDYFGQVSVDFYPKGTSYGYGGISSIDGLTQNGLAKVETTNGFNNKITIYTNKLLDYMKRNEIYKLNLKSVIDYLPTSDEYSEHSKNYTIYRTGFKLENASVTTAAYTPREDYNYFNSNSKYKTFEIKIPVKNMDNYGASTIASSLASNISNNTSKAKVYYDKTDTNSYITPKNVYSSGSNVYLVCDTPADYANTNNVGITVVIENAKATYNSKTYSFYNKDDGSDDYKYYISTHKVDTKGLTHTVMDENGKTVNTATGFDSYKKEHKFQLSVDAGQPIFIDNNKGGRTEGNFSYRLYSKDGKSEIALEKHNGLVATSNVPHTGGTSYRISSSENLEGEYKLIISSKDLADNLATTTVPVKLDNLAPRATYTVKEVMPSDNSKRNEYKFNIEDASGTGKLHYVFVRDGYAIPNPSDTKPDSSGPQDTVYEKWGFINQTNSSSQTIVLNLVEGDYFKGRLYWYTEDAAGNDSRKEGNSKTDGNGYYYKDIELSNVKADCEIIVDDVTPGKSEYKIGFETNSLNKVEYRWIGKSLSTPKFTYTSGSEPGSAVQKDGSGNNVTLNGEYTLEYTVITPGGETKSFSRKFLFDNINPTVTFESSDNSISDTKKVKIIAEDISNIETVKYQLLTASGEAIGDQIELSAGLPVVSNEVILSPDKTGAYKIKVTATDVNGHTTEKESFVFYVRTAAPSVEVTNNIVKKINSTPVTNSQEYELNIEVSEEITDIGNFDDNQVLQYRISGDGVNYSEWIIAGDGSKGSNTLNASVSVKSPVALNSGDNRIYVQTCFTQKGADASKVRNEFICTNNDTLIIYDTQAPQYKIEINNTEMTNKSVKGTLTFTDDYSSADAINFNNNVAAWCIATVNSVSDNVQVIDLDFIDNVEDGFFALTDEAGNSVEIPIEISCIDYTPPKVEPENSYKHFSGYREDFYLSFWVDEAIEGNTSFALVPGEFGDAPVPTEGSTDAPTFDDAPNVNPEDIDDSLFGPIPANEALKVVNQETEYNYENGESRTYYEIMVYADEEKLPSTPQPDPNTDWDGYIAWEEEWTELNSNGYIVAARSEDALGNVSKQSVGYGMVLKNATAAITGAQCTPEKAGSKTVLVMDMSVPVYVMPDSKIPDEIKTMNLEDGRLDTSENATVASFAESVVNHVTNYTQSISLVIDSLGEKEVYFADEAGRVYKQTVMVKDLAYKESDESDERTAYVSFGNEPPVTVKMYKAAYDDYYDMTKWTEMNIDTVEALDMQGDYGYFIVVEGNNDTVSLEQEYISGNWNEQDFTIFDDMCERNENYAYTKLVYEVCDTPNTDKIASYTVNYVNEGVAETTGSAFELNLKDATGPVADIFYSTKGYTKDDVTITISASDPERSLNPDAADTNPGGLDPTAGEAVELKAFTDAQIAQNAGIASIAVSDITAEYDGDYSRLSFKDLGQVPGAVITFESNGYAVVKITNTLGLVTYEEIEVTNINKDVIESGKHYNVNFYYINNEGKEELVNPDGYYKEVIAKVEFTEEGISDRELEVTNNMGEEYKTLNSFDNMFNFKLKDKYGHTKDVDVSFSRFDTEGPMANYKLLNSAKTNKPVDIELNVTDLLSSAAGASLTAPNGDELDVTPVREENDEDTGIVTKVFKSTVSESGYYKMTATDIHGNVTYKNFAVNNIDKTPPVVIEKMATSVEPTTQMVGVKLYYSEPGVVITRAEVVEGTALTANDVIVNYNDSALRFNENGSVNVWFEDEYGNEGTTVVSVNNINRTPPSLSAVTTLAEDTLSVDVSFVKNEDEKRDLSELYVLHSGITPMITEMDDDGNIVSERVANASEVKFTFIENGTYKFYAYDSIGNIQEIDVDVTGIDRKAPIITNVSWSYKYMDENGIEQVVNCTLTPGDEVGYNIVEDETYKATNQDITATVTTDDPTKFVGSTDNYSTTNSIIYDEDGWFNFDLVKRNNLMDRYGLGLYLIDKEPPVIENVEDLMFFENPNANDTPYDKSLLVYSAYDERYGEKTDLTSSVKIDWGGFNPDDITKNIFDKNKPYTVTYTVKDKVGNETSVKRKITLVGLFDTMIRINGKYPDSSGRLEVIGNSVEISLDNFGGTAYARYEKGIYSMGEMKNKGTVITPTGDKFKLDKLSEGWYTLYVQTDLKDYFCVNVYVYNK